MLYVPEFTFGLVQHDAQSAYVLSGLFLLAIYTFW